VTFDFTGRGRRAWEQVTRTVAERGQAQVAPGQPPQEAFQHFVMALDDKLISVPYIDFRQNPKGIDATNGSQIEGGYTVASAQNLANLLKSGALPVHLELVRGDDR
jgi:SecD/SecF fusion protein